MASFGIYCLLFITRDPVSSDEARARFLREYEPVANRIVRELSLNRRVTVRCIEWKEDSAERFRVTYEYLANDRCAKVKVTLVSKSREEPSETWYLLRPDGWFEIAAAKQPNKYILKRSQLKEITMGGDTEYPFGIVSEPVRMRLSYLVSYVQRPTIQITDYSDIVEDGISLKRLQVTGTNSTTKVTFYFFASNWLLHSYLIEPGKDTSERYDSLYCFHYQTVNGSVVPHRMEVYRIGSNGTKSLWASTEYEYERADPPDYEFALTQFDLPEMGTFTPRTGNTLRYIWIILAAIACATVAIIFWYRAQRFRA